MSIMTLTSENEYICIDHPLIMVNMYSVKFGEVFTRSKCEAHSRTDRRNHSNVTMGLSELY